MTQAVTVRMHSQPDHHQPEPQESDLELRPIVKYIAIGLGVATLLGVEYATYHFGVERGYAEGVASGEVMKSVNDRAVENLRHFMQTGSADDAVLVQTAQNYKQALAWIKDDIVRQEATWTLAQALITRGLPQEADAMLRELLALQKSASSLWVRRALVAARAYAADKHYAESAYYYDYADAYHKSTGDTTQRLNLLNERLSLLQVAVTDSDLLQKELSRYAKLAAELGEKGHELVAGILVTKGRLYREQGTAVAMEKANRCFEKALEQVNLEQQPELASAAVCVGSLLLEKGDKERATAMLRDGLRRLGDSPSGAPYMLLALRDLARIEQENGNTDIALALLYRAEGVAMTHEPEASPFWNCLYDQRGWLNLQKENFGSAQQDFENALARTGDNTALRAQPLEGVAQCCLTQGLNEKAAQYLTECLQIRQAHFPADLTGQARVQLTLARIHDMNGSVQAAADAYGEAARLYEEAGDIQNPALIEALFARAYALTQLKQWTSAAIVWDSLKKRLPDDHERVEEIDVQLRSCTAKGAVLPSQVEHGEEESEEP